MAKIKILGINSSPRKKNGPAQQESSTRILLQHALDSLGDRADVELIDLVDCKLHPSEGCYSTSENLLQCDHYKDDSQKLFKKIIEADGIIFSSPVYWLGMSSRLAALFERMTELDPITRDPKKRLLQGKVAGAIATAHVDGAANVCYDILKKANYLGFIIPPHAFAFHTVGQMNFTVHNKETLKDDFVAFKSAEMVAENVYQMCLLTKGKQEKWSVYYELVRPKSSEEQKHIFDFKKEDARIRKEKLKEKNKSGKY